MFVVSRYVHASYCLPLPESRHLPFCHVLLFYGGEGPSGPWGRAVHRLCILLQQLLFAATPENKKNYKILEMYLLEEN